MMLESLLLPEGGRLHHNPLKDEQADYEGRLTHTKNLYYDLYHSVPPHGIWGNEARVENAAAQEVDDEGDVSEEGQIGQEEEYINITIRSLTGKIHNIRIDKKSLASVLFDAISDHWQVTHDQIKIEYKGRQLQCTDQWALNAKNGDRVYYVPRLGGC
jgi:hypothetical protein